MQEKARIKKLKFEIYANFDGQLDLSRTIHLHKLLRDAVLKNSTDKHTIIHKFLADFDKFSHILPLHVIGDPLRLK